ncbi:apoptotic protease-activating factor 1-like [Ambystoma mexicanum]|uniref:apoptotic protease-activating factor 1-like n=1 Tax=Ambystoma mexicanum TaxID=8296 RepID=UPI0037E8AB90
MEEKARACLLQHRAALQRDLRTAYLLDHLINDEVLSLAEEEYVRSLSGQGERTGALIDILLKKDGTAYISLYKALLQEGYRDLAALLQTGLPGARSHQKGQPLASPASSPQVQSALCQGGVPQRPVVFVPRSQQVQAIREHLLRLEPGCWVVLHGMAGSGKSVLAAEALRDPFLLEGRFPGGVHWVTVGKKDKAGLLMKLQNLLARLDLTGTFTHRPPLNLEEARDRLRLLLNQQYPKCLLILDDVWDPWVLKAFDVQCRVLLTSRDRSVSSTVSGKTYFVEIQSGLSHEEALQVLSLFVNLKVQDLPEHAHDIVRVCKGSPLVVSLVGALLRDFPNRWDYYVKQLQKKQFKRIRKSSSYDYEALDEAMSISVDMLRDELKEYYKDLSVIKKDMKVPTQVLCLLWDMETEEVEDILQEFVNKSLLFCDRNGKSFMYYLHDLQLDFLTEQNRQQLCDLHAKVVHQYHKHYSDNLLTSLKEDTMYWYSYLSYHMASANLHQELRSLLFSLDWIKSKTQAVGPAHLIHEFADYKVILDNNDSKVREDFQSFLSLNGHILGRSPFPNIIQLGLGQPETSAVFKQARAQAVADIHSGGLYIEWINRKNVQDLTSLVVRPHTDAVYHACFSPDGQRIASCGADKTLQVFKTETGENLLEIDVHNDEVLCCAFSADGKYVATCSADTQTKVWNSVTGKLLHTYDEHTEQVNCCQFANKTNQFLATCSSDCLVKFWDLSKAHCRNTFFEHTMSVNHISFSPSDDYLASCSADGSLRICDVLSANEIKSLDFKEFFKNGDEREEDLEVCVKCCSWSRDSSRIMAAAKNRLFIFDFETSNLLTYIQTSHQTTIQYCDFCPNSPLAAIAVSHYSVELWNTDSALKVGDCSGHLSWVHCLAFSPDGSLLLTSSEDQTVRLWETTKVCNTTAVVLKQTFDVVFRDDEVKILVPDDAGRLHLYNGKTGDVICQTKRQTCSISCCCLSRDINLAAVGGEDGSVKVFGVPSANFIKSKMGHKESVQRCQFTSDGQTLVSSSDDGSILVWHWQIEKSVSLKGHVEAVKNFRLLKNSRLLSWSFDGTVKLWSIITGKLEEDITCHEAAILSCDVSPDATKFVSTSADKSAKIWHFGIYSPLHKLTGHKGAVRCCRFSNDNTLLATGDDNGEIRIWSATVGELLRLCSNAAIAEGDLLHSGWVTDIHFSSDGKRLVSTGGYLKWWNVDTGESLQTFYMLGSSPRSIYVLGYFKMYVTIDNLGILYVLKLLE